MKKLFWLVLSALVVFLTASAPASAYERSSNYGRTTESPSAIGMGIIRDIAYPNLGALEVSSEISRIQQELETLISQKSRLDDSDVARLRRDLEWIIPFSYKLGGGSGIGIGISAKDDRPDIPPKISLREKSARKLLGKAVQFLQLSLELECKKKEDVFTLLSASSEVLKEAEKILE